MNKLIFSSIVTLIITWIVCYRHYDYNKHFDSIYPSVLLGYCCFTITIYCFILMILHHEISTLLSTIYILICILFTLFTFSVYDSLHLRIFFKYNICAGIFKDTPHLMPIIILIFQNIIGIILYYLDILYFNNTVICMLSLLIILYILYLVLTIFDSK